MKMRKNNFKISLAVNELIKSEYKIAIKIIEQVIGEMGFKFNFETYDKDLFDIDKYYPKPEGNFWIGKLDNDYAGTIALRPTTKEYCELKRFYVLYNYRGKGLGKLLIDKCLKYTKYQGHREIRLDTNPSNKSAIYIFKKRGFIEIDRYWNAPPGQLFMSLKF